MSRPFSLRNTLLIFFLAALAACGAGGSDTQSDSPPPQEPGAPLSTGNTATDGFNWFNFRRNQIGLATLVRNSLVDKAAQSHSDYQQQNNTITHEETPGKPGYTGATVLDRLHAAGYQFGSSGYAYGEVISKAGTDSGTAAAEDLIAAIYHRFVIFEPMFKEAGAGATKTSDGLVFFTTDFVANGLKGGLGSGNYVVYPFPGQSNVPVSFFSDNEEPDPVPSQNEVGYPISVHADVVSSVSVTSFTVKPHDGAEMTTRLLTKDTDPANMASESGVAAIIPLTPLQHKTSYDVQFVGSVDGVPTTKSWSFTTR